MSKLAVFIVFLFLVTILNGQETYILDFEDWESGDSTYLNQWKDSEMYAEWGMGLETNTFVDNKIAISGKKSLRVRFPQGFSGPQRNGILVSLVLPERDEYYMSYWFMFSDNFDFNRGGKLPGLAAGKLCSGGQKCDGTNGFTARFMWQKEGGATTYFYHMDKPGRYGDSKYLVNDSGDSVFFERGKWYHIMERVKINSSENNYDGEVEVQINNQLVFIRKDLRFTSNGEKVNRFSFSTFHGGSGADYAPKETCFIWFDNLIISTQRENVLMTTDGN